MSYSYYKLYFQQISTHGCVIHVQNVVNNSFILHINNSVYLFLFHSFSKNIYYIHSNEIYKSRETIKVLFH